MERLVPWDGNTILAVYLLLNGVVVLGLMAAQALAAVWPGRKSEPPVRGPAAGPGLPW